MRTPLVILIVLFLGACSGGQDRRPEPPPEDDDGGPPPEADEPLVQADVRAAITRPGLAQILGPGPGYFLGRVEVEAVVEEGRFAGWRLTSLPDCPAWLDIQEGDVVTAVNGMPLERPDDAQRVYEALQVASEIRIDLTRNGERRAVRIVIDDVEAAEGGGEARSEAPGEAPAPPGPEE